MDAASYCRARAKYMRALAETTFDYALRDAFLAMARDYEEVAEDLKTGAKPVRHPDLLPETAPSGGAKR